MLVNHQFTVNGYIFGNNPRIQVHQGQHVRWYLMTVGDGFNFHTPHWHGNVVMVDKHRTDKLSVAPAQFVVADMVPVWWHDDGLRSSPGTRRRLQE